MYEFGEQGKSIVEEERLIQTVVSRISSFYEEDTKLMISIFDVEKNKFVYCNNAFFNILGYTLDEIISGGWSNWYNLVKPDEAGLIKNKISLLLQSTRPLTGPMEYNLSYHIKDVLNKWYLVNHRLSLCLFNNHLIILNYLFDITQIERIEYSIGIFNSFTNTKGRNSITVSKREREVLMLIAEGFSSKQIAEELYISNHTAIKHRKNLIEKFHVKNTAQLIKEASKRIIL